jgi:hypothetical protein
MFSGITVQVNGEVPERLNGTVSKTVVALWVTVGTHKGMVFERHPLRYFKVENDIANQFSGRTAWEPSATFMSGQLEAAEAHPTLSVL